MAALRAETATLPTREAVREAQMRLEIAKAAGETDGRIAVVCGAWHVPALAEKRSLAADRAVLKGRGKAKIKATWAPWTTPRLSRASGYGAGVVAPGWCGHLWATREQPNRDVIWLARIVTVLRERGHFVSTASAIEAQRLGVALAALRERPAPGFEELRDAAIACLCFGERAVWDDIAAELLVGSNVGAIPDSTPLAPLLEECREAEAGGARTGADPRSAQRERLGTLDVAAPADGSRCTVGSHRRCRAQSGHLSRELAVVLGTRIRSPADRKPRLWFDHCRGCVQSPDRSD